VNRVARVFFGGEGRMVNEMLVEIIFWISPSDGLLQEDVWRIIGYASDIGSLGADRGDFLNRVFGKGICEVEKILREDRVSGRRASTRKRQGKKKKEYLNSFSSLFFSPRNMVQVRIKNEATKNLLIR